MWQNLTGGETHADPPPKPDPGVEFALSLPSLSAHVAPIAQRGANFGAVSPRSASEMSSGRLGNLRGSNVI